MPLPAVVHLHALRAMGCPLPTAGTPLALGPGMLTPEAAASIARRACKCTTAGKGTPDTLRGGGHKWLKSAPIWRTLQVGLD